MESKPYSKEIDKEIQKRVSDIAYLMHHKACPKKFSLAIFNKVCGNKKNDEDKISRLILTGSIESIPGTNLYMLTQSIDGRKNNLEKLIMNINALIGKAMVNESKNTSKQINDEIANMLIHKGIMQDVLDYLKSK